MATASQLATGMALRGSSTTTPRFVYGTAWKQENTADLVYQALKKGFRGIDTAAQPKHYNEKGVGEGVQRAIRDGIVSRGGLYIQTKFSPPSSQGPDPPYNLKAPLADKIHQSIKSSLSYFTIEGQEPYFDCVVLHSPLRTIEETVSAWKTLETYVPDKIRNLGISNTTLQILEVIDSAVTVKPSVVQNRFYGDTLFETDLRSACASRGIVFQSFWTLSANPRLVRTKPVMNVAAKAGVNVVAAYYSLVLGLGKITVLNGTTSEAHMDEDLKGIQTIASWAEGAGAVDWENALAMFKQLIGDT